MILVGSIIFLITFNLVSSLGNHCSQWYISSDGNNCTYCPPGTFKYMDCDRNGEGAICKGCGHGHYQTICNQALSCEPCSKVCPYRFAEEIEHCTLYTDIKCMCTPGRFLHWETFEDGVCLHHSQCVKGYGFVEKGTQWNDTVCSRCLQGKTFSDDFSLQRCKPCKTCIEFKRNCSTTQDAECEDKPTLDNPDENPNNKITIPMLISIAAILLISVVVLIVYCYRRRRPSNRDPPDGEETIDQTTCKQNVCNPAVVTTVQQVGGFDLNHPDVAEKPTGESNEGFAADVTERENGQDVVESLTGMDQIIEATTNDNESPGDSIQIGPRKCTTNTPNDSQLDNISMPTEQNSCNRHTEQSLDNSNRDITNESCIHANQNFITQETNNVTENIAHTLETNEMDSIVDCSLNLNTLDNLSSDESVRLHARETNATSVSGACFDAKYTSNLQDIKTLDDLSSEESVRLYATETNQTYVSGTCSDTKHKPYLADSITLDSLSSEESVRLHARETNKTGGSRTCSDAKYKSDLTNVNNFNNPVSIESVRLHARETKETGGSPTCSDAKYKSDLTNLNTSNNASSIESVRLHARETNDSNSLPNNALQMQELKPPKSNSNMVSSKHDVDVLDCYFGDSSADDNREGTEVYV